MGTERQVFVSTDDRPEWAVARTANEKKAALRARIFAGIGAGLALIHLADAVLEEMEHDHPVVVARLVGAGLFALLSRKDLRDSQKHLERAQEEQARVDEFARQGAFQTLE